MGASWSSERTEESSSSAIDLEKTPDPPSQSKYPHCYGDVVPSVCSNRPEDLYDELYEQMYFVQHTNQECIVAFNNARKKIPVSMPSSGLSLLSEYPGYMNSWHIELIHRMWMYTNRLIFTPTSSSE